MVATAIPPPLPPAPPPVAASEIGGDEPSFLQKFISQNSQPDRSKKTKQGKYTNQYMQSQCLVPITTPEQALPDVKPLLSLSESDINKDVPQQIEQGEEGEFRTALQDFRQIMSLCASYQHTADTNRKIFQFKSARWKLNKALKDTVDEKQKQAIREKLDQLEEPPYDEEYSELKVMQNYTLAGIMSANQRVCLANATCPRQTKELIGCYATLNPKIGQALAKQGLGKVICMEEREAVERCIGNAAQRAVKEIIS